MSDDHEPSRFIDAIREKTAYIIGVVGLIAWFIMLWLMFGDVL
ncbi:hypothetical protein [Rhizorhapis sp. SPR117]